MTATAVTVTGLLPQVRFDLPATPLAFVQSSGRARVLQSHMVLMLQAGNIEHIELLRSLRGCALFRDCSNVPHLHLHYSRRMCHHKDAIKQVTQE